MRYKYNKFLDDNVDQNVLIGRLDGRIITPKHLDDLRHHPEIREFAEFVADMNEQMALPKELWKVSINHPDYKHSKKAK